MNLQIALIFEGFAEGADTGNEAWASMRNSYCR